MCGICGVVCVDSVIPLSERQLLLMRDTITHRGPDDAGHLIDNHVALGSRRLSILDLSPAGHMPMTTFDGRYSIVYNGEVYNYREFRSELEDRGYKFRSNSDTETLLYLYAEYGPEMLSHLIGMFSIAIWDSQNRELFLARDRLGIKPLVYAEDKDRFLFASEEKSLIAAGVKPDFNDDCWDELLYFRYISGENTIFRAIRNLLPGHYLIWKDGRSRIHRYWHLKERIETLRGTIHNPVDWYRETLESAVRYRLISDVPVGVLLSGGLDSSTIATLAGKMNPQMAAFTVRFNDEFHDEGVLAREVSEKNSLRFHELFISAHVEISDLVKQASWYLDAPLVHGNDAHILAISRHAKNHVTVLLSGEGGDETLGGYVRYKPLQYSPHLMRFLKIPLEMSTRLVHDGNRLLKPRLRKLQRFLRQGGIDDLILFNSCDVLPVDFGDLGIKRQSPVLEYRRHILREAKQIYPGDPIRQAMYLDQHTFLQSLLTRNDRMTMGASIECRVPFLDHRLVEGVASLETSAFIQKRNSKALLREAFGYQLPRSIMNHRKVGFSVPWDSYMRDPHGYRPDIENLTKSGIADSAKISRKVMSSIISDFLNGNNAHMLLLRQLLFVDIWEKAQAHNISK